jgi:hypothetical protein
MATGDRRSGPRYLSLGGATSITNLVDRTGIWMPDVSLDPDHPQVCLATVPITDGHPLGLAVLSAHDGPQLWLGSARGWDVVPLPLGRRDAARLTTLDATRSSRLRRLRSSRPA